jgi:hypothetical protein
MSAAPHNGRDIALQLAAKGFNVFALAPGLKIPPKGTRGHNDASRDQQSIRKMFPRDDMNVGIRADTYNGTTIFILDIDGAEGEAALAALEEKHGKLPETLESITRRGRHLIFQCDGPVGSSVAKLGAKLDVRGGNGYIVAPGSTVDGHVYHWKDPHKRVNRAPVWFHKLARDAGAAIDAAPVDRTPLPGVDVDRAVKRGIEYLATAPQSIKGSGGDATAYKVAAKLKDVGCTEHQALDLMLSEHWHDGCGWPPERLAEKVAHAYRYGQQPPGAAAPEAVFAAVAAEIRDPGIHPLDKMNKEYAFILAGGHVLHETTDEKGRFTLGHLSMAAFHTWFKNKRIQIEKKNVPMSEAWLEWERRREYTAFVFAPGKEADPRFYNLWHGFAVEPAATGKHPMVDRFLEHALQNVCNGDKKLFRWLIGYFAHLIQRPWEKPLVALVFKGKKGTGKNALIERIAYLLGNHALVADDRRYLLSNFNGHFENNLLFVLDEAVWAGDKQGESKLKGTITGSYHNIEHKGEPTYKVANLSRVVLISNADWVVPASQDERRFAVFEVGDGRKQDRQYFQEMREGLDERGGAAHLLRYLMDYELAGIDVNAAPDTIGLANQKAATLAGPALFLQECASAAHTTTETWSDDGAWIDKNAMHEAYSREAKANRNKYPPMSSTAFWLDVHELFPELNDDKARSRRPAGRGRQVKLLPLREARARLVEKLGVPDAWAEEPDDTAKVAHVDSKPTHDIFD